MGRAFSLRWFAVVLAGFLSVAASPELRAEYDGVVSAKAVKYHDVLRKRPEPGYLFDRFYNTWLDEATVDDLQKFLVAQADQTKATPDQLLLAYFYAKQGDDIAALEQFRSALASNPGSAEAWYQKAAIEARTLDFETAIADLQKAREQKPDAKLAMLVDKQLGRLLVRDRQVDEALKVWNELLAANPRDEELAEDLIELHIDEGLFKQAAALAEGLLKATKDPYLAVTRRLRLGDIHQRAGSRENALEAYSTALNDVGHESWLEQEILAQTEQVFRREDNLSQLKDHYTSLLGDHPKRIALHRRHAKLLVELGEQDAAMEAYKKILELTPGDRANREEYVEVLAKIGKKDQAVEQLRALCGQHPEDGELRFRLATLLYDAGKADDAATEVAKYLAASDKSEYAYLRAARALERFERKPAAAEVYKEMAATFADSASAQEAYAGFLYANEKKDEALAIWRQLADGAELSELLHVARALSTREEHVAALELLQAHKADFAKEPLYFSQLASTAIALKKPELALPWTRQRVELAASVTELEAALDQAIAACDRADQVEAVAKELSALPQRSIQQTCLLAELHEAAGDSAAADAVLAKAAEGGNLLAISEQIRLFNQRRDWAAAAEATRRILELPGGRKSLHVRRLVELCQRDFQIEEALKWIAEWKRLSPGSTSPWTVEASLLRLQGEEDEAIAVLKSASQKFEGDEDLRLRLAQLYSETDHPGDAERIYWQLYEDTEDVSGKLRWAQELAKLAEQQGKIAQLVENFEERRQSNRQSIVPLLALSEVHRTADNYEGRRQALTAAAKIKPDDLELLHHIARIEEQEGHWEDAIETLKRAAVVDKTNRTKERIAKLHLSYGNADDGFAILFELAGAGQGDPRTLEAIADAMCGIQEWERAADFLAQRIADHPSDYRLRYLMAVAAEEAGRTEEAMSQFLQLLDDQEELPDVAKKNSAAASMQNSYMEMIGRMAPREAVEWMELSQYQHTAYQHQHQRGNVYVSMSSVGSGGAASHIQLPARVNLVRPMALAHLTMIAKLLDEDQTAELARGLKARGVQSADVLLRMGPERQNFAAELPALLEENPENETALALVVLQQFGNIQPALAEYSGNACDKFRQSHPDLAVLAGVQAGLLDEQEAAAEEGEPKNEWFDKALAIAAEIKDPNAMTVMATAISLSGQPYNQQTPELPEAYRKKFSELLLKWYPGLQKSPQYGQHAFVYVVAALAQSGDPTEYIAFLEDEVARWRSGVRGQRNQQAAMFGGHMQQGQLLAPLAYPPQQLADFPPTVLMLLQEDANQNPYSSMFRRMSVDDFDAEKVAPLVEKVRDPVLRLLLARRFEQEELENKTLELLLASETPQLDAYLLAAGKAFADDKPAEAVKLLANARYLPMNREVRTRVDAAIVAAVLAAKESDASSGGDEELLEAGRQACLRLRQSRLDANKRTELVSALEDLGLKKEAQKLDQIAATQPATSSGMATRAVYGGVPAQASQDRVAKLVADGKRDAALRLLSTDVLAHARQLLAQPQSHSYMRHQFRELKKRVEGFDMTKELLTSLDPGDADNPRKVSEYAVVCEMFDRKKEARAAYERILEKRPKNAALRMRLVMLLAADETSAAEEHLEHLGAASSMTVGQMFMEHLNDYELSLEERMGLAELAAKYLGVLADEKNAQTSWSTAVVQMLAHQMHTNQGSNLPSLYAKEKSEEKLSKARAELIGRRAKAHRQLCEEMLKTGDSARQGFRHLLAAAEARGEVDDEFTARAAAVIQAEADRRSAQPNPYMHYYSSNDSSNVRLQTPEEFLVRQAAAKDDWKLIEDELLPKLREARNKQPGRDLERLAKLYRCSADEFIDVARQAVSQQSAVARMVDDGSDLEVVVAAWADRKLDVDIQPIAIERLKRMAKGQNHHQMPGCIGDLVEATYRTRGGPKTLELLEQITEIYLGPKQKRDEFVSKNNSQNSIMWGSPSGAIYVYANFMSTMLQRENVAPILVLHLQGLPPMSQLNNVEHYVRSGLTQLSKKPAEELLVILEGSPWLGDLDAFHPLDAGAQGQGVETWLSWFLREISGDQKCQKAFHEAVAAKYKERPTFGLGLINAYFGPQGPQDALLTYVAEHLDEIRAVDEARQAKIGTALAAMIGKERLAKKDLDAAYVPLRDWLRGSKKLQSQQVLEKVRNAKRLEDLSSEQYQAGEQMRDMVTELISTDPAAVQEIFFRFVELIDDAQKRNQWHMYYGDGSSTAGHLLRQFMQNSHEGPLELLPVLADVIKNNKKVAIEYPGSDQINVTNLLRQALDKLQNAGDGKNVSVVRAIKKLHVQIGEAMGNRSSSLFLDAYLDLFRPRLGDDKQLVAVKKWAKGEIPKGEHREVAANFYAAACMLEAERQRQRSREVGEDAAAEELTPETEYYHKHFRHYITTWNLPLAWRLHLGATLVRHDRERLPTPLLGEVLETYTAAIEKGVPITHNQHREILPSLAAGVGEAELEKTIAQWQEQWAKRYLRAAVRTSSGEPDALHSITDSQVLASALKAYLRLSDQERANQLLRRYDSQLSSSPIVAVLLLRAEQPELAAKFLRAHWADFSLDWPGGDDARYDQALEAPLAAMCEQLSREEEKLFARALVASLPDSEEPTKPAAVNGEQKDPVPSPRDERMTRLAKDFANINFGDDSFKTRTLVLLSRSRPANALLSEAIAEQFKRLNLQAAMQQNQQRQWQVQSELAVRHFDNEFRRGESQAFVETFDKFVAAMDDNDYEKAQKVQTLISCCVESLKNDAEHWTPAQCAAVGKSLRSVLVDRQHLYLNDYRAFNTAVFVMHVRGGEREELKQWRNKLSRNCKSWVDNHGLGDRAWHILKVMAGEPLPENLGERLKLAETAIACATDLHWLQFRADGPHHLRGFNQDAVYRHAINAGLLTRDELMAEASKVDPVPERHFMANVVLAEWLNGEKAYAPAAALWEAGEAKRPKSWRIRGIHWKLDAALAWARAGNNEKARAMAEEFAAVKLADREKNKLKALTELIAKQKQDNAKPEAAAKPNAADDGRSPQAMRRPRWNSEIHGAAFADWATV